MRKPFPASVWQFAYWSAVCAALWTLLAEGQGWTFGVPTMLLAAAAAVYLDLQPWVFRPLRLPAFLWFFLRSTFDGAFDVARRSVSPGPPIAPAWLRYEFTSPDPQVRLLASAVVGLFPGTLATKVEGDWLHVHVLDERTDWCPTIAELERELAAVLPARKP
ncbi:Na+/H+ antiporter subunit E [Proteobacteria bacterium 005FR1]|nr:Na+/H+ antiporter subunit E [Proteobacteria bacterium 005FR1]